MDLSRLAGQPVIIGAGIAGLATALFLAPRPCVLISKGKFGAGATAWAQGGIAAALGPGDDTAFHAADTIAVGGGLVDPDIAALVTQNAGIAVETLASWGVPFDRDGRGNLLLGLEAGHSRPRIVHAGGDATGSAIIRALAARVQATPSITLLPETAARHIIVEDGTVSGVVLAHEGETFSVPASQAIIATGGIGQLYAHTTNPKGATADGLLLAARAGAILRDIEFVQFHPTAIGIGRDPMPLATEALRGQGARLMTVSGKRLMESWPMGDLSPRDIVARVLWAETKAGRQVGLDCRDIANFAVRFPTVNASCLSAGIDPSQSMIPVRPAAHYHMGGIEVDTDGATSVKGLWACGESASTGLHGANRLASNSLLEAVVFARRLATALPDETTTLMPGEMSIAGNDAMSRTIMDEDVGVLRDASGLKQAVDALLTAMQAAQGPDAIAGMIAAAALLRQESRGAHYRSDFPDTATEAVHSRFTLPQLVALMEKCA